MTVVEQEGTRTEVNKVEETWYCLYHDPKYCADCDSIQVFLHVQIRGDPRIVIFPTNDDEILLKVAQGWMEYNYNPQIKKYEKGFGKFVTIDKVRKYVNGD